MIRFRSFFKGGMIDSISSTVNEESENRATLFVTKTCPNCKSAEALLMNARISYRKIYVEDRPELAVKYNLKQAPAVVFETQSGEVVTNGISNLKKYLGAK